MWETNYQHVSQNHFIQTFQQQIISLIIIIIKVTTQIVNEYNLKRIDYSNYYEYI